MKALLVTAAILSSTWFNYGYGTGTINMNEKLEEVVKFEKGTLPVEKNKSEFVKVSFKINENGKVEIIEMNYSDETIKAQLMEKLAKMKVEEGHHKDEVYNYHFTFKKL